MKKKEFRIKGAAVAQSLKHPLEIESGTSLGGFIIIGLPQGEMLDDFELVEQIKRHSKNSPVVLLAGENSEKQIEAALKIGMGDIFHQPYAARAIVDKLAICRNVETAGVSGSCNPDDGFIVGKSEAMTRIKEYLKKIAVTDSNVLLTGETGTGKDIAAEFIHNHSRRKNNPLLSVNCTAFPESLLESELFGYEKGTFTSALTARPGKFEMASGGTLFLDEIGDMGLGAQAKILRAIEKKEIWRIGGDKPYLSDFRLITATNREPEVLIRKGLFRDDLYYRLNIARVHLPPLRERKEDIADLVSYIIGILNTRFHTDIKGVSQEVMEILCSYSWPGNIRQLNNIIEASFINSPSHYIHKNDLPESFLILTEGNKQPVESSESESLHRALHETGWNISKTAVKMNVSRMTLYRKMAKHNIHRI
jgi:transcriptional regulator with PAS, ATPase and Fis domain